MSDEARKMAVVVVDAQEFFRTWDPPIRDLEAVASRIAGLLDRARDGGVPVIYVQHLLPDHPGEPMLAEIVPSPGDIIVRKSTFDSFQNTTLVEELTSRGIGHVLFVGFKSDLCLDTACRRACSQGYKVTLVSDCHATCDNPVIDAGAIERHTNHTMKHFAEVTASAEVEF